MSMYVSIILMHAIRPFILLHHIRPNQENHHKGVSNTISHHLRHTPRVTQIEQNQN